MQPLQHSPEVIAVGSTVVASGVRGAVVGTAMGTEVSALVPAGADEVSLQAAFAFSVEGVQALAINTMAQQEVARAGAAYVDASGVYAAVDESGAALLS